VRPRPPTARIDPNRTHHGGGIPHDPTAGSPALPGRQPDITRSDLGARGEAAAAAALAAAGYRILGRNLRTRFGEIDLLVRRHRTFVAVEVKTRGDHPAPERCVQPEQLERIARALRSLAPGFSPRPSRLRIDVVSVVWRGRSPELCHLVGFKHVPGAVDSGDRAGPPPTWRDEQLSTVWTPLAMPTLAEQIIPRRKLLLLLCETALFMLVVLVGTSLPPLRSVPVDFASLTPGLWRGLLTAFTIAVICQASLSYNDLYDWKTAQNRAELPNRLLHSAGYALVMLGVLSLFAGGLFYLPGLRNLNGETWKLIALVGVAFAGVYLFRHGFHWFFYKWRFGERVVVVGTSPEAHELARMIVDSPMAGFELVGLIEEPGQPANGTAQPGEPKRLGSLDNLRDVCRDEGISRILVALRERRNKVPVDRLLECRMDGVLIEEREAMYERLTGKLAVESMRPSYLIYGRGFGKHPLTMALKRVIDILAALIGLVLTLPLSLLIALLVKTTSKGPVFFMQERVGEEGKHFRVVKFRTMRTDAEKDGPQWAQKNDSRVTGIGRILRRSRLDEIPQFLNVLAGSMSFVGPRPERQHFVDTLKRDIPFYMLRHTVKPGLTGWAQVRHPYGASTEDAQEKLRYDLYYIKNMSLLFDLNIMFRTIAVILRGSGAR
jgi:sugar transferase (PEP-CTERM system associated)